VTYISLFWQPIVSPSEDYEVFAQLWNDTGVSIGGAHDFPYGGMYRTRIWPPDEIVVTHHWIEIPDDLAIGRYTLVAGFYRLLHNENLPVTGSDADSELNIVRVPELRFAPSPPETSDMPLPVSTTFGDVLMVESFDVSVDGELASGQQWEANPGQTLTVNVNWQALQAPESDYSMFLHLTQDTTQPPAAQVDAPIGGSFPTGIWRTGDLVRDQLQLQIPADLSPGTYDVLLGAYLWQTGERLPVRLDSGETVEEYLQLGQVVISD
jgi:hypothetical protein